MTLAELDRSLRNCLHSAPALRLARRTARGRRGDPWRNGACLVAAEAIVAWLGDEWADIMELSGGAAFHLFVRVGSLALDADGVRPVDDLLRLWSSEGGLDRSRMTMRTLSVAEAEHSGAAFDDYARDKLIAMLGRAIDAAEALATLSA